MKQKAKVKRPELVIESQEQAQTALADYSQAEAKLKKINATIDEKCQKIREQYSEDIQKHEATMSKNFEALQDYAQSNEKELFKDSRSVDLVHGSIGFRTGKHQLKTLKGFTWDAVINLMKAKAKTYLRIKTEVDKAKLIADRDDKKIAKLMPLIGVEVIQEESFYVETKAEELVES